MDLNKYAKMPAFLAFYRETSGAGTSLNVKKAVIDAGLGTLLNQNDRKYDDPKKVLLETMRDIGRIQMDPKGLAIRHLEHFLGGSGASLPVDVKALLNEDEGVRNRVVCETHRRALAFQDEQSATMSHAKPSTKFATERERKTAVDPSVASPRFTRNIDPVISIFQSNFKSKDWQSALGSYAFEIELISTIAPRAASFWVMLKGSNVYRWHSGDRRVTQDVHKLGQAMVDDGLAAEYAMPGGVHYMQVSTRLAAMIALTSERQANPQAASGTFADGAGKRAAKVLVGNEISAGAKAVSNAIAWFGTLGR